MSASATASLELRRANNEALDITPFVDTFVWTDSMLAGGFSWYLQFTAQAWREWDDLMLGREKPVFQFRLRSEEDDGTQSTEWRTAITDKSNAAFSQDTSMIGEIKGADRRLDMAQEHRTRKFLDVRASDVFARIASEHGLTPDIARTSEVSSWTQVRMDDWAFMREMARQSSPESGRGDTYLWLEEDTLHYAFPTLSDLSDRSYDLSVVESRVENYVGAYSGREADRFGAATLIGVGFNFDTKKGIVFTMDPAAAASQPSLADRVPRRMGDGRRVFPVFEVDPKRVEEHVRARWGQLAPRYLSLRVNTRPDLTLRPNKIIAMENNLGEDQSTPFLGRYAVLEVRHVLKKGSIETSLLGCRREAQEGDAQPTGASADQSGTRDGNQTAGIMPRTIVVAQELG